MALPMRIDLLTLFPGMADGFLRESVVGKAIEKGVLNFQAHDIRKWTKDSTNGSTTPLLGADQAC